MAGEALLGTALMRVDMAKGGLANKFKAELQGLGAQTSSMSGLGGAIGGVLKVATFGIVATGVAMVGLGIAGAKMASDFESSMTLLQTQAGYTRKEIDKLRPSVMELSNTYGVSAKSIADSLYHIASSGIPAAQAIEVERQAVMLAKVGHSDLETTTNALAATIKAYGQTDKDAAKNADILNAAVGAGNMRMGELATTLPLVLGSAAALKIPLNEVTANLATLTQKGISAHEAGTALNGLFMAFTKTGAAAKAELHKYGLTTDMVREKIGPKGEGLAAFLIELDKRTKGNLESMAKIIPNVRALRDVLGTTGASSKDYLAALDAINKSTQKGATLNDAWKVTQQDFNTQLEIAKTKVENHIMQFGTRFVPLLEKALPIVMNLADRGFGLLNLVLDRLPGIIGGAITVVQTISTGFKNFGDNVFKARGVLVPLGFFILTVLTPAIIGLAVTMATRMVMSLLASTGGFIANSVQMATNAFWHTILYAKIGLHTAATIAGTVATIARNVVVGAFNVVMTISNTIMDRGILGAIRYGAALVIQRAALIAGTVAQWALNVALSMNPIGLVIIAIGLLAAGFIWAYTHVKPFRDIVNFLWDGFTKLVGVIMGPVLGALGKLGEVADKVGGALNAINPFAKHSPSLVDNVALGTTTIAGHYQKMATDIHKHATHAASGIHKLHTAAKTPTAGMAAGFAGEIAADKAGTNEIVKWLIKIDEDIRRQGTGGSGSSGSGSTAAGTGSSLTPQMAAIRVGA